MIKKLRSHAMYYFVLIMVLFLGFLAMGKVRWIFILLPVFYATLAILHHAIEHTLTPKIVVEYTLIAAIGMAIFTFILIGGL